MGRIPLNAFITHLSLLLFPSRLFWVQIGRAGQTLHIDILCPQPEHLFNIHSLSTLLSGEESECS